MRTEEDSGSSQSADVSDLVPQNKKKAKFYINPTS